MTTGNKLAVIALTTGGADLAVEIARKLNGQFKGNIYLPQRLNSLPYTYTHKYIYYFDDWHQCVKQLFNNHRKLVFIMATGIVVRSIAPLLVSKHQDPGVVVVDETARFVISLTGGHAGGANELANRVAKAIGAVSVITTATDVREKTAVDVMAAKLNCSIYPLGKVKLFNRMIAEGESIQLFCQWQLPDNLFTGLSIRRWEDINSAGNSPSIIISNLRLLPGVGTHIKLRPRNLVLGVGCRKGVTAREIIDGVKRTLANHNLSVLSLKSFASVDIKRNELGLIEASNYFKVPLDMVTREQIIQLTGYYTETKVVKEKIGVGAVCEPAAIQASGRGQLLVPKQIMNRVTVAVAEQSLRWWE